MNIYFKHSTRCPISSGAKIEIDSFLRHNPAGDQFQYQYEIVDVIGNRDRSNELADQFSIEHESPQIIITNADKKVVWSESHREITEESIKKVLEENK